jgi:phosphoserine phosphatase RsbU/P
MPAISIQSADGPAATVPLRKDRITIGRSRESDIFLPDQWLSRTHAEIRQKGDGYYLEDLGSKNGTLLNGAPIQGEHRLSPGDVITLGEHVLVFSQDGLDEEEDVEPEGTRVFSVRELSHVATRPAGDPEELARQNRVLATLSHGAAALIEHRPLPELFERILNLLFEAIPAERGAILLLEGDPPQPVIKASRSRAGHPLTRVSRSIARRVLEKREALLLPNLMEDASFRSQMSILSSGIRSASCAPLWLTSQGGELEVIGLVYLDSLQRSHSFTEEDLSILTSLANVAAAKIENVRLLEERIEKQRLEEDIRVAAEIQSSLLPQSTPAVPGYGLAGLHQPCRTVGGDYYDFILHEGRLLFALGDVSGKGTGAALLMTVLRASVRDHWTDPEIAEAVARINRTVSQNVPGNKYITFFMGRLDPGSGRIEYVNAGHNPPLLVRADGSVDTLGEGGMVLGFFESVVYARGTARLHPGDTLLVFSDGVTETWSPGDEEFGDERLVAVAVRGKALDPQALQEQILKALDSFAGGAKATDDRTLIVLKRR